MTESQALSRSLWIGLVLLVADLPHVLLAIAQILMFIGAPLTARAVSRQPARVHHA